MKKTTRLAHCGLFAALTVLATLISIKIPWLSGAYMNAGDGVIHACAFVVGGLPGAAAVAVGSAIADIILGSVLFAPGTFIIKGAMALVCSLLITKLKKPTVSVLLSGLIMPLGYLAYEFILAKIGLLSFESALAYALAYDAGMNMIQYTVGCVIGILLIQLAMKLKIGRAAEK